MACVDAKKLSYVNISIVQEKPFFINQSPEQREYLEALKESRERSRAARAARAERFNNNSPKRTINNRREFDSRAKASKLSKVETDTQLPVIDLIIKKNQTFSPKLEEILAAKCAAKINLFLEKKSRTEIRDFLIQKFPYAVFKTMPKLDERMTLKLQELKITTQLVPGTDAFSKLSKELAKLVNSHNPELNLDLFAKTLFQHLDTKITNSILNKLGSKEIIDNIDLNDTQKVLKDCFIKLNPKQTRREKIKTTEDNRRRIDDLIENKILRETSKISAGTKTIAKLIHKDDFDFAQAA